MRRPWRAPPPALPPARRSQQPFLRRDRCPAPRRWQRRLPRGRPGYGPGYPQQRLRCRSWPRYHGRRCEQSLPDLVLAQHGLRPRFLPQHHKSLTDAINEFGDGVRLTTGPRSRDPRGLHLGRPAFYRFRVVARERSGAGRFSLWRFCGPRCMIIPWAWSATAPRTRTIVSGARRIGLGRSITAPRACKCKPAVRRIMPWIDLSSRPSGPSADGTMPVRSHRENAVRLRMPDVWTMPSPAYCCGENI